MDRPTYRFGDFGISLAQRRCWWRDQVVPLTATEFEILTALLDHPGKPVGNEVLFQEVWPGIHVGDATLRKHIQGLRRKLQQAGGGTDYILNFPNRGYLLAGEVKEEPAVEQARADIAESEDHPPVDRPRWRTRRLLPWAGAAALAGVAIWVFAAHSVQPAAVNPPGRLFVHATSEGAKLKHIPLSHRPDHITFSADGRKVFVTSEAGRTLSVIDTMDDSVKERRLPIDGGPLKALRDGRLFIGSSVGGLMVWDIRGERLLGDVIRTGGPVIDIAATPNGDQLFLALGTAGLKRVSTRTLEPIQLSDRLCPMFVETDRSGKGLYVSYQCSGPTGRPGQDPVEILDAATGKMIWKASDLPMVGGPVTTAPDGRLALFDGQDACAAPAYRGNVCPEFPSRVFHLFSAVDHRLLKTFPFAPGTQAARFIDNARFVLSGATLYVIDARKYTVLERMDVAPDWHRSIAFHSETRQLYLANLAGNNLLVIKAENAGCSELEMGLEMLFSADGTFADTVGLARVEPRGDVRFRPGKVGQAFSFERDGSKLVATWVPYFEFSSQDATIALYVKFAGVGDDRVLLYRMAADEKAGMALRKSAARHLIAEIAMAGGSRVQVESQTAVKAGVWYHVAVTRTDQQAALYVNGVQESAVDLKGMRAAPLGTDTPLYLGAKGEGRFSLSGMLDEVAFYNRALSAAEVDGLFRKREAGPCRP